MIYLKIHDTDEGHIIAMCDESLIGKVYEEKELVIDLKDYSDFYIGDLTDPENLLISRDLKFNSANIVGEESIKVALKNGLIEKENINSIMGIPYAHTYWMNPD